MKSFRKLLVPPWMISCSCQLAGRESFSRPIRFSHMRLVYYKYRLKWFLWWQLLPTGRSASHRRRYGQSTAERRLGVVSASMGRRVPVGYCSHFSDGFLLSGKSFLIVLLLLAFYQFLSILLTQDTHWQQYFILMKCKYPVKIFMNNNNNNCWYLNYVWDKA